MEDDKDALFLVVSSVLRCVPGSLESLPRHPGCPSQCPFGIAELCYPLILSPDADNGLCLCNSTHNSLLLSDNISDPNQNNNARIN